MAALSNLNDNDLSALNDLLSPFYQEWLARFTAVSCQPLFIVGPPRSGTTLLTQLLAKGTDIGFVNNLTAKLWRVPALAMALQEHAGGALPPTSFESEMGATKFLEEPSEFGFFWRRWFAYEDCHALSQSALSGVDAAALMLETSAMSHIAGRPMMFKNLAACGMNAGYLSKIFSDSLFLLVDRPWADTARSILNARLLSAGRLESWFSVRPPGTKEREGANPIDEVVWQVKAINEHLNAELSDCAPSRMRSVKFDDLIEHPNNVIASVLEWMARHKVTCERTEPVTRNELAHSSRYRQSDVDKQLVEAFRGEANVDDRIGRFLPLI